jgi:hypothetical protein
MHPSGSQNLARANDQEVKAALQRAGGKVKTAARDLGISRQALHERLRRKPYLRPPSKDGLTISDEFITSAMVFQACLYAGEMWAAKGVLSAYWKEPRHPRIRPRYSDVELEKLIRVAGGHVGEYRALRDMMAPSGYKSLAFRRRVIGEAAALTLSVPVDKIWQVLKRAWLKLQFLEKAQAGIRAREQGQMKR